MATWYRKNWGNLSLKRWVDGVHDKIEAKLINNTAHSSPLRRLKFLAQAISPTSHWEGRSGSPIIQPEVCRPDPLIPCCQWQWHTLVGPCGSASLLSLPSFLSCSMSTEVEMGERGEYLYGATDIKGPERRPAVSNPAKCCCTHFLTGEGKPLGISLIGICKVSRTRRE